MIIFLQFICAFLVFYEVASVGEYCSKNGAPGVCKNIQNCPQAIEDIKKRRMPQICSFEGTEPVVCCPDVSMQMKPVATTTKRSVKTTTTTEYTPQIYDYESLNPLNECEPIPASYTPPKNGQKAHDKCIEYQEKYVYPCERGVALSGLLSRANHCHHSAEELIIGGQAAENYEFPHMALVGYGDTLVSVQFLCGGSIISDNFVLTAGHCVSSRDLGAATYIAIGILNRSQLSDRTRVYKIKRIVRHPQYKPPSKYNDIALMETEKPFQLSQYIVPACLDSGVNTNDTRVQATGWGLTTLGGATSETLQKVYLNKFSSSECSEKFQPMRLMKNGFDAQSQICYGDKSQSKDTCQGDSGGPIQIKSKINHCMYTLVGVTSFGKACGFVGEPGIYTRVANYVPWIESVVWP